jgi:hypothetical protein
LDVLNGTLRKETEKIRKSYDALNDNYASLIMQQKSYLDDISRLTKLTNEQILALKKNNEAIDIQFSRRANVEVYAIIKTINGKYYFNKVQILNSGNIECDIEDLDIKISNQNFNCLITMDSDCFTPYPPLTSNIYKFKKTCPTKRIINGNEVEIEFPETCYFSENNIDINYKLTYRNQYETETIQGILKSKYR